MLEQVITRTPVWVWPLLAFLLYRGYVASMDREVRLAKLFIIPVVMLALSVQGITTAFGTQAVATPVWLGFTLAGAMLAWLMFDGDGISAHPERGSIRIRGNWSTMALIMGIFVTKYAVNASLSLHPELKQELAFVATACALFGIFNGVFIGQLLRVVSIYRGAAGPV